MKHLDIKRDTPACKQAHFYVEEKNNTKIEDNKEKEDLKGRNNEKVENEEQNEYGKGRNE